MTDELENDIENVDVEAKSVVDAMELLEEVEEVGSIVVVVVVVELLEDVDVDGSIVSVDVDVNGLIASMTCEFSEMTSDSTVFASISLP